MDFRLLIVDDSPAMRTFIRRVIDLSGLLPVAVLEAGNGREALEVIGREHVDIVLSDINMPVMDGEEFLEELLNRGHLPQLPVVIVSTDSTSTRMGNAMRMGARGYVRKPFTPEKLRCALEQALEPLGEVGEKGEANPCLLN